MNYNVHNFRRDITKEDIPTRREIMQIITHEQPDIIGFEEFLSRKRTWFTMVDSVQKALNTNQYYFQPFLYTTMGMAIFSKYPIVNKGIIWINGPGNLNQCLYIDVKKNNRIFRVYTIHLQSIRFNQDDRKYIDGVKEGKTVMQGSQRIGSKLKQAFLKRSDQVDMIKQHMAACPYPYIIMGDFNDTPSSYAVNQMSKGLKNAFREKGSGLGRTYNGDVPNYQIDYILVSKQFNVLTYGVIRKKLSDHYPVYSDLQLK
ncbi:endonuclease/exonuclease/phosphatase family protein [Mucilaginibacter mali]|uniref:Endonuclease/exonuclease/phosphatase family protein n=1 Tax=Mucilaginibacter mali TaxID=2740462 RepID=A0A7D4UGF4_9SPHI|nr:endonuclease/exonuclease/phosphatase family protein [Mucilaginibacter mali]QKJ31736.1 endonuclease/exonuclease/phosphatase family protein [Mucilaginibacter mali]